MTLASYKPLDRWRFILPQSCAAPALPGCCFFRSAVLSKSFIVWTAHTSQIPFKGTIA